MRKRNFKSSGYSAETAEDYINVKDSFLVTEEAQKVNKYDEVERSYTNEFSHTKLKLVQQGGEVFTLKLEEEAELKQGDIIHLEEIEACEVNRNVYFKARKAIKKGHIELFDMKGER
jgi:hypothetical protein